MRKTETKIKKGKKGKKQTNKKVKAIKSRKRKHTRKNTGKRNIGRKNITRVQRGGNTFNISIKDVYDSINKDNFEICGQAVQETDAHNIQLIYVNKGEEKLNRKPASCSTIVNYPMVWHTHPKVSKYYPSLVDIFKVIKHSSNTSYIFTQYGFWHLYCPDEYDGFDKLNENPLAIEVNKILDEFYYVSGTGREYNSEITYQLVDELNKTIQPHINSFRIAWYEATDENLSYFV